MKLKHRILSTGIFAVSLAAAVSPAYARSNTGFSAFRLESPLLDSHITATTLACINENNGAVVNNCTYTIGLEFDLPIDTTGKKKVTVRNYFTGTTEANTFSCGLYVYTGKEGSSVQIEGVSFTGPLQEESATVDVRSGENMQLICFDVPPGGGIASLDWNQ
jgi:hypothetical protein